MTTPSVDSSVSHGSISTRPRGLSSVVIETVEMMRDPATNVAKLGAMLATEPSLRERVLRAANAAVNGIPGRVSSLPYAITLLGFDALRDTLMRPLIAGAFRRMVSFLLQYEEVWNHSVCAGLTARIMVRKSGLVDPEEAFIAGLFHDVGIIVTTIGPEGDLPFAAEKVLRRDGNTIRETHAEIGAWLAEEWGLGPRLVDAIRHHHQPEAARIAPDLAAAIHIADVVSQRLAVGRCTHDLATDVAPQALTLLGLQEDDLHPDRLREDLLRITDSLQAAPDFESVVRHIKAALVEGISTLPPEQRLTVALVYQEGLSFQDVARLLSLAPPDVEQLHARALVRLLDIIHQCV